MANRESETGLPVAFGTTCTFDCFARGDAESHRSAIARQPLACAPTTPAFQLRPPGSLERRVATASRSCGFTALRRASASPANRSLLRLDALGVCTSAQRTLRYSYQLCYTPLCSNHSMRSASGQDDKLLSQSRRAELGRRVSSIHRSRARGSYPLPQSHGPPWQTAADENRSASRPPQDSYAPQRES